jgi:hypothetical protein
VVRGDGNRQAIRNSKWLFPVIESVHLLGLALIGGAVLMLDLRLLNLGLRRQPVRQVAADAQPWLIGSLVGCLDGDPALPVGIDQVLLQSGVLGEDDVSAAGDRVRVHGPAPGSDGG